MAKGLAWNPGPQNPWEIQGTGGLGEGHTTRSQLAAVEATQRPQLVEAFCSSQTFWGPHAMPFSWQMGIVTPEYWESSWKCDRKHGHSRGALINGLFLFRPVRALLPEPIARWNKIQASALFYLGNTVKLGLPSLFVYHITSPGAPKQHFNLMLRTHKTIGCKPFLRTNHAERAITRISGTSFKPATKSTPNKATKI